MMNLHEYAVDLVVGPLDYAAIQIWKTFRVSIVTENTHSVTKIKRKKNKRNENEDNDGKKMKMKET